MSDEDWYFATAYLTLMNKDTPRRCNELREMFNALRWIVRAAMPWRLLPNDFPPCGSNVDMAVDIFEQLLAAHVMPANEQEHALFGELARQIQHAKGQTVKVAFAYQGYTCEEPAQAALDEEIELQIIKRTEAKNGFVPLPRRWAVDRGFGWLNRFHRLAGDQGQLPETLAGLSVVPPVFMPIHFVFLNKISF
ncbi:transposase [Paraburkholderia youngii]|uniref:Transposase n=1 Tax=Paraburkholderia youngii TaxID=2782701 RepID=A0A7Y6KA29_9BURK|nr:transposase [Paraburkholderia youngii]NUY05938.1 transposase [Paraburkholderia youngii]